ncbi:hypothetical protein EON65_36805 [archaeon]|nr:MAG: hypothetical protein EON65_36805 [archaeon]
MVREPILQSIHFLNWGNLANTTVRFPSRPALTVLTGETISGKSMLLHAIHCLRNGFDP